MPTSLVVGASRGLGFEPAKHLHALAHTVYATIRSSKTPDFPEGITVIQNIDVGAESAGKSIVSALQGKELDLVFMNAGLFKMDSLNKSDWNAHLEMYKVVSMAPLFIAHHLVSSNSLATPSKYILITSEGGSISLRTREEGGGAYGHHASKAAANMVGKVLANDLYEKGITVAMIHPGFMKTDMTKSVGFDEFYESGGAIEPSEAAASTIDFVLNKLTHEQTGTFWAPRGPSGIGEAERVMGKDLPTPLQLPW
ncbi:oxidoreductase [Schizophyllum commune]